MDESISVGGRKSLSALSFLSVSEQQECAEAHSLLHAKIRKIREKNI